MINKKIGRWRTEGRRGHPVAEVPDIQTAPSPEDVVLDERTLGRFDAAIKDLPPVRRKVAFLHWYCGWTVRQIAEWNGSTASTPSRRCPLAEWEDLHSMVAIVGEHP
jgi:DNA-directed RNA polymerase specialized sigma24 family protein